MQTIEDVKMKHFYDTLMQLDGNRAQTAKKLGISIRTVLNWIKKLRESNVEV